MIIVNFDKNELCKKAYGLWQYDYGQVLRIQGLNLPTAAEIHFALQETGGEAVTRIGITKDGVTDVTIPDSLLEADGASQDYQIYVFVYLATPDSGETTRRITLGVKSRPRPEAFNTPGEGELFEEAIQAVNDAAKRAEDAGKEATAAAGEAKESASLAGKYLTDTQVLTEQVEINADLVVQGKEEAARLLAQTQSAASNAALSAETAKQSETAAKQAQTAAETAEDTARQYAEETEADRREVAESKQSVEQMQSNVARMQAEVQADREAVEQTVSEFGQTAQDALTAIGQAQNTAVSAVQTEGQRQATAVRETGTQAVNEVETAKTAAVGAVTSEGDKQVVRVQEAAAEIVADREQIQQNKTNIAALTDKTNTLAPGIILDTHGKQIAVSNASEQSLVGLNVYGKSTQVKTTGAQLFDWNTVTHTGEIDDKATISTLPTRLFSDKIRIESGTEYTLSVTARSISGKNIYLNRFILFNSEGAFIKRISMPTSEKYNITFEEGVAYVKLDFRTAELTETIEKELLDGTAMFNKGDAVLPYEPYTGAKPSPSTEYPQDIVNAGDAGEINVSICGKNLVYIPDIGVGSGEKNLNSYISSKFTVSAQGVPTKITKNVWRIRFEYENGNFEYVVDGNLPVTIKVVPDNPIVKITIRDVNIESGKYSGIQLELGSVATPYEPYKPAQALTLSTPNGLPGIPVSSGGDYTDADGQQWVCDEIDLERGKYVQRIETRILDGTEAWKHRITNSGNNNNFQLLINDRPSSTIHRSFCNYLPYKNFIWDDNIVNLPKIYSYNSEITASFPPESEFKSVEIWNSWLKEKGDFKFQYVLATPIERDLTPEEIAAYKSLHTYSGTTVVTNDSGAGMSLTYTVDTKKYIDEKIAAISTAMIGG